MVDINNLTNGRKPVKLQRKVQQDAPGKVNRVKEIRRRGKDGLKINRQQHFVRKKLTSWFPISARGTQLRIYHTQL